MNITRQIELHTTAVHADSAARDYFTWKAQGRRRNALAADFRVTFTDGGISGGLLQFDAQRQANRLLIFVPVEDHGNRAPHRCGMMTPRWFHTDPLRALGSHGAKQTSIPLRWMGALAGPAIHRTRLCPNAFALMACGLPGTRNCLSRNTGAWAVP